MSRSTNLRNLYGEVSKKSKIFQEAVPDLVCDKAIRRGIKSDALSHIKRSQESEFLTESARIEHPLERLRGHNSGKKQKYSNELKLIVERLNTAWAESKKKYSLDFSNDEFLDYLIKMVQIIEPSNYGLRNDPAKILGYSYRPPDPEKLNLELFHFLEDNGNLEEVLDKSANAHFNIARIHPFTDGNGRLARLVSNTMLYQEGYPPVIIKEGERYHYYELLEDAKNAHSQKKENDLTLSPQEELFYMYLTGKINTSLDKLLAN
jgi:prophage maintenance system killer protein